MDTVDIPENFRKAATEEPEDFSLDGGDSSSKEKGISFVKANTTSPHIKDEFERADEEEQRKKEEEGSVVNSIYIKAFAKYLLDFDPSNST